MTEAQFRKAKKLIRALCANFDNGNCLLLDDDMTPMLPHEYLLFAVVQVFTRSRASADRELFAEIMESDGLRRCAECGAALLRRAKTAFTVRRVPPCGRAGRNAKGAEKQGRA
jgi:hypothetical protein